jgi:hypothetical protein
VKIKMGLVYDFSDYKTLSKYIREGKVDTSDRLSSDDGNTWTALNEIENLEQHFCEVYLLKKKEMQEGGTPAPKPTPKSSQEKTPVLGAGLSDLASVLAEASAEVDGKPSPRTRQKIRPNTQKRPTGRSTSNRRKPKKTKEEAPKKSGSNTFPLLILLLVASGGGFFYWNNMDKEEKIQEDQKAKEEQAEKAKVNEQDRERLNKDLEEKMEKVRREREAAKEEKKKNEPKKQVKTVDQIEAERLLREREEEKKTPKKKSISDLQREGEKAQRTRNWAQAEKIYQEIVSQRPSAKYQVSLGRALYEQKKFGEAKRILKTASKGDVKGYMWLGYIARDEGDDAGANQYFSTYLKSNPVDAAIIQRVMNGE